MYPLIKSYTGSKPVTSTRRPTRRYKTMSKANTYQMTSYKKSSPLKYLIPNKNFDIHFSAHDTSL